MTYIVHFEAKADWLVIIPSNPIAGLDHEVVTTVQCGASHSLAVSATGKLYCWGKNSVGQCGKGTAAPLLSAHILTLIGNDRCTDTDRHDG